jgi:cytochrome c biogenesis protein CcdA
LDKNALEQLMSSYNFWMGVSTIAVAAGILGEYVAHFIFEKEARKNTRAVVVSLVFGAAVLGGVVGEYVCGKKLSQVSDELQRIPEAMFD